MQLDCRVDESNVSMPDTCTCTNVTTQHKQAQLASNTLLLQSLYVCNCNLNLDARLNDAHTEGPGLDKATCNTRRVICGAKALDEPKKQACKLQSACMNSACITSDTKPIHVSPDRGDLLDNISRRVQVQQSLVDPHLKTVPSVGTLTGR